MKTKPLAVRWAVLIFALSAIMFLGACHKKTRATAATATTRPVCAQRDR